MRIVDDFFSGEARVEGDIPPTDDPTPEGVERFRSELRDLGLLPADD